MSTQDPRATAARPLRTPAQAWKIREAMLRDGFTPAEVEEALQDTGLVPSAVSPYAAPPQVGYVPGPTPVGYPAALLPPAGLATPGPAGSGYSAPPYSLQPPPAPAPGFMPRPAFVPGQGYPGAVFMAPTGKEAYMLGFLAYIPIPVVSSLITGAVMALAYSGQRRKSTLAAENGRRAANWGLTYALATLVIVVAAGLPTLLADSRGFSGGPIIVLLLLPLGIAHLVVTIRGAVVAGRGEVFENPLAIPFLRPGR